MIIYESDLLFCDCVYYADASILRYGCDVLDVGGEDKVWGTAMSEGLRKVHVRLTYDLAFRDPPMTYRVLGYLVLIFLVLVIASRGDKRGVPWWHGNEYGLERIPFAARRCRRPLGWG